MVDARTKRRRGANRSRSLGVAVSLLAHLAFVAILAVSLKQPGALRSGPAVDVELVPLRPASRSPERHPTRSLPAQATKTEPKQVIAPPNVPGPSIAAARPAPITGAPAASGLTSALRGSVGCDHADLMGLSPAERQRCRDQFATAGKDPGDLTALGIDPVKRAAFDAAWKADHSPQHMAAVGCFMRFGAGQAEWLHPSEGFRLGRLPCYFVAPKATLSADPLPAQR